MLRRIGQFAIVFAGMAVVFGMMLWLLYTQEQMRPDGAPGDLDALFTKTLAALLLLAAVAAWWLVLAHESRRVAQEESDRQTKLLMQEIDAHLRTDRLLQEAKELAETANLAKSRFLTGISHEMRSPLTSILGFSQLMRRDLSLAPAHRASVDTIHRSGEHMAGLVDGLLELSRIEAGKLVLAAQVFDLDDLLGQIARMFEPLAQEKRLGFALVREGSLPARVRGDPKRLRQILINLLGNAVKFTASGRVELHVSYAREIAHIEVLDTGMGIDTADQQRIFQPFERLSAARGAEGIGLGLTITRLLVQMMGGDIRVESTPGQGSRFRTRLFLPRFATRPGAAEHRDRRLRGTGARAADRRRQRRAP
ncbi:MAG: HAMP domain-containing sensor histidine kinase [Burkholderiaceae bacterium]